MFRDNEKCPICGGAVLKSKVVTEEFSYKGKVHSIPGFRSWECASCGESIADRESMKKAAPLLNEFYREVDGLLSGAEIRRIRSKLNITQDKLGDLLGGGKKAFARYENNQVVQSRAMDTLLRFLDRFPALISMVKNRFEEIFDETSSLDALIEDRSFFYQQPGGEGSGTKDCSVRAGTQSLDSMAA
jgi:HTH-type transcriptional regulator/antitoxin MqsA